MNGSPTVRFDPSRYETWRRSRLGRITGALELDVVLECLGPIAGQQVLDVGCGDGQMATVLARAGAIVSGIDPDARMLEAARERFKAASVEVRLDEAEAEALPFESGSFDVVTAMTVLCFVHEPARAIAEMARVLKPGGRLMIGELGRWSLWAAWRQLRAWLGNTTWREARFRTASDLRSLATAAGLTVQAVRAAVFFPPVGWIAALLAPFDRWLGRRIVNGGAFVVLTAVKPRRD